MELISYLSLSCIILLNFVLHYKVRKLPLHPDSGLFLYKAVLSNTGEKFTPGRLIKGEYGGFQGDSIRFREKFFLFRSMDLWYKLVPANPKNFRLFFIFYNTLTILSIFTFGKLAFGNGVGIVSALVYVLLTANPFADSSQLHIEHYAVLPLVLVLIGLFFGILTYQNIFALICAGIFLCLLVILYKITFLIEAIALGLFSIIHEGITVINCLSLAGFICTILGINIVIYSYCNCAKISTVFSGLFKSLRHYKETMSSDLVSGSSKKKLNFSDLLKVSTGSFPFFSMLIVSYMYCSTPFPHFMWLLLFLIIASSFSIIIQGKYYMSHILPLFPIVSLLSGNGILFFYNMAIENSLPITKWIIFGLFALSGTIWLRELYKYHFIYSPLEYHLRKCSIRNYRTFPYLAEEIIADYINKNSQKWERIVQWGYNHELYVLAKRRAAVGPHLESSLQTDPILSDSSFGLIWRQWLVDAITWQKPIFIVDMRGSLNIDTLNKATGLSYKLEKLFYSLFPLYKLQNTFSSLPVPINVVDLTTFPEGTKIHNYFQNQETYINYITDLVNQGQLELANQYTHGQITRLFKDWELLNK